MTKEEFTAKAVTELLQRDFAIHLHQKPKVEDCGGWFDYEEREFVVAMANEMGFEIFVHEYSHFKQWVNKSPYFIRMNGATSIFFDWLKGTEYPDGICHLAWKHTVELELDCEKQALCIIADNNLPVDVDKYVRAANAYLLSYQFVAKERKWPKTSAYNYEDILNSMPKELQPLEYYFEPKNIPDVAKRHFEDCFTE